MLIHQLKFTNFLTFHGEQVLDFPAIKDPNKPFNVILAPTNTGKTSTIQALRFLLYANPSESSDLDFSDNNDGQSMAHSLINNKAKDVTKVGARVICTVEGKITIGQSTEQHDSKSYTFRRSITSKKTGPGIKDYRTSRLITQLLIRNDDGGSEWVTQSNGGRLDSDIDRYIPETIFNLFFFSGEPGQGRIDPTKRNTGIGGELNRYLRLGAFDEAVETLENLNKHLTKVHNKHARTTAQFQEEEKTHIEAQDRVEELKKDIQTEQEKLEGLVDRIKSYNDALSQTGKATKEIEAAIKSKNELLKRQPQLISERQTNHDNVIRSVASKSPNLWLNDATSKVLKLTQTLEVSLPATAIIPKGVNIEAIQASLDKGRCATCTEVLSDEIREQLETYFEAANSKEKRDLIRQIRNEVSLNELGDKETSAFETSLSSCYSRDAHLKLEIKNLELERKDLDQKIDEEQVKERRKILDTTERLRRESNGLITSIATNKEHLDTILTVERRQREVVARAKSNLPAAALTEVNAFERKRERIQQTKETIRLIKDGITLFIREYLQDQLTKNYDHRVSNNSKAVLNRSRLVPDIKTDDMNVISLGGGETQLMEIAYVVGLSSLTRALKETYATLGLPFHANETTSIVADSAFDKMGDNYIQQTIEFLEGAADQVILIMHQTQWASVQPYLTGKINSLHAYKLHTPKVLKSREYSFEAEGHQLELSNKLEENAREYSTSQKIF